MEIGIIEEVDICDIVGAIDVVVELDPITVEQIGDGQKNLDGQKKHKF